MPDNPEDRPSLEMPSFSLRPRKKNAPAEDATPESTGDMPTEPPPQPEPESRPEAELEPEPEPGTQPEPQVEPQPEPELLAEPQTVTRSESQPELQPGLESEPQPEPVLQPERAPTPVPHAGALSQPEPEPRPRRGPGRRPLPVVRVSGLPAAILTGVAVGALALLLSWLAGVGCEAVRGTSACGGGPGLLILLVVLAALAWEGTFVLRALVVPHAGSISLLAVGILAVLVLVFLLGSLDEAWALVAVPVASAVAYAASWWVTTTVADDDPAADTPAPTSYDVR